MDQAEKDAVPGRCSPPSSHGQDCNAAIFFPAASQTLRDLSNTQKADLSFNFFRLLKK